MQNKDYTMCKDNGDMGLLGITNNEQMPTSLQCAINKYFKD